MSEAGDRQRLRNIQMAAADVACCRAGQQAYPQPCPWHGRTDPMYILVTDKGRWFS